MQGATIKAKTYAATEARTRFSDLFDAAYFGERVVVTKRNRQVAMVSMEFIERVDALLAREAAVEAEAAKTALEEFHQKGGKTMKELKQELDMD